MDRDDNRDMGSSSFNMWGNELQRLGLACDPCYVPFAELVFCLEAGKRATSFLHQYLPLVYFVSRIHPVKASPSFHELFVPQSPIF